MHYKTKEKYERMGLSLIKSVLNIFGHQIIFCLCGVLIQILTTRQAHQRNQLRMMDWVIGKQTSRTKKRALFSVRNSRKKRSN